jgi:hypothetical protein
MSSWLNTSPAPLSKALIELNMYQPFSFPQISKNGEHPEAQTKVNLSIDFFTDIDGTTVEDNGNISKSINLLKKIGKKNE